MITRLGSDTVTILRGAARDRFGDRAGRGADRR